MPRLLTVCPLCAVLAACKASPAQTTEFLGEQQDFQNVPEIKAFHKAWAKPGVVWDKYKTIYIAPVEARFLRERTAWQKMSFAEVNEQSVRDLAEFTRQTFVDAHRANTHKNRLEVVTKPQADSVILELAVTEVVPTNAWLNAVSLVGVMTAVDKGSVAIESRLRDASTNEIIAKFADRESGKQSLINVKDLTWYSHARDIIREWARQSVEVVNAKEGSEIADSSPFELKAW